VAGDEARRGPLSQRAFHIRQTRERRAIGYVRVSTTEQAEEGLSLANQREKVEAFCKAKEWKLVDILADEGASAKDLNRPTLQELLRSVAGGEAEVIVVYKLDRLTRSVKDLGYLMEDVFAANGVAFSSIQDNFDTTTANGKLVMNIIGSVAQWERDTISERTSDALAYKNGRGEWAAGRIPFGFKVGEEGRLVESPEEMEVIAEVKRARRRLKPYRVIAERFGLPLGLVHKLANTHLRSYKARYIGACGV
jgi:site-specific DNA recombinase